MPPAATEPGPLFLAPNFTKQSPLHVAIIMDGNGRWAAARGKPRSVGHRVGTRTVKSIVQAAQGLGIGTLTLFAFSADNWARPQREVSALMRLFHCYLRDVSREAARVADNVRLSVIGDRVALSPLLRQAIEEAESATTTRSGLHLRIAVNYSARAAIVAAAARLGEQPDVTTGLEAFRRALGGGEPAPDVDLLVRTGGEQRLSDFLLWECAYAELVFTPRMWPDFSAADLEAAIQEFHARHRRFGRVA